MTDVPFVPLDPAYALVCCGRCKAVVAERWIVLHETWHRELEWEINRLVRMSHGEVG